MQLKLLVTGTGRCGTLYYAKVLTQLGIPCGHESLFDFRGYDGLCERLSGIRPIVLSKISSDDPWVDPAKIVADSTYGVAPYLRREPCKGVPVLHIVRHPMLVISSFVQDFSYFANSQPNDNHWQDFIYEHLPELRDILTPPERACFFYVRWNRMIMAAKHNRRYMLHRIEEGLTPKVLDFLTKDIERIEQIPDVPTTTNTRRGKNDLLQFRHIRNGSIKDEFAFLARELGYRL